ncbi:MAG TPA: glycosyltransferase [Solirubrobacterales bacterium]|nr:glycosyltransferase [Solirubrobacterales bacterium]
MTTLLVASTGGHLKQLHRLHERLEGVEGPYRWATFDTAQSRSLLADEEVDFVPFVGGRDPLNVLRNAQHAHAILSRHAIEAVVSTGSAVALPFFALGRGRRLRCHYIESAARTEGPSITGSLIGRIQGVNMYAQYRPWAFERGWYYGGSVFDSYEALEAGHPVERLAKVVVTLGTYRGYEFPRLVLRLLEILPPEAEVLWQTGETDVTELGLKGEFAIPERDLTEAMREADVVIAHAGVGATLAALEVGKCPVLVPRRLGFEEHVDDHQTQIATELGRRRLAVSVEADQLSLEHLIEAAGKQVKVAPEPPSFELVGPSSGSTARPEPGASARV